MTNATVEIAVESIAGLRSAQAAGAGGIELCLSLALGGTTPSAGLVETAADLCRAEMVVLVRPRPGDFVYDGDDRRAMQRDIEHALDHGVDGVAVGALTSDGAVDADTLRALIECARPMRVTFHRAFDRVRDREEALETLMELEVDRVLTSGGAASAFEGRAAIAALAARAEGRIELVPAGGITPGNAAAVAAETGARTLHASASRAAEDPPAEVSLGALDTPGARRLTDAARVRAIVAALEGGA